MRKVVIYSMALLLVACGVRKGNPAYNESNTTKSNGTPEVAMGEEIILQERPVYNPSETQLTDLIHTKLEVNFD